MEIYRGRSACPGVAIGKIKVLEKEKKQIKRRKIENIEEELKRCEEALEKAKEQLVKLYEESITKVGAENAEVFEIHQMMLEDEDYRDSVFHIISSQNVNAEYAIGVTADNFADMFESMEDEYMRGRSIDIRDISERVINILMGSDTTGTQLSEKVILLADDLTPSETVQMDETKILAFVTIHGSVTSHTAILARMMNIPAIVGAEIEHWQDLDGLNCVVCGTDGRVCVEPNDEIVKEMQDQLQKDREKKELLSTLKGKDTITRDGRKINLFANIGSIGDIALAQKNDAEGVGLFRSEFLYLQAEDYPTEEEQFVIYRQALQLMGTKKLIVRTCDIGADKKVSYFNLPPEENPALGFRAIRICLDRPDFFKTQLRALFRAAVYGNLSIMYPMIISLEEVHRIKAIVSLVFTELEQEGIPYKKNVEQGIMIETPAAALISDQLAKEVDFFSVGTNDLTQYTLAIDRQNQKLEEFCDPHHKAIIALIEMAANNAHKNGKWIGICGELGADLELTETFLKMGIDELSVSPGMILYIREKIRETDVSKL